MERAFRAGMRHVDHFWCAMSSVASLRAQHGTPMHASMEQFVLSYDGMSTEVIADGEHLSKELLEFAYKMKVCRASVCDGFDRALGMPPGRYRFGPVEDGRHGLKATEGWGSCLARGWRVRWSRWTPWCGT